MHAWDKAWTAEASPLAPSGNKGRMWGDLPPRRKGFLGSESLSSGNMSVMRSCDDNGKLFPNLWKLLTI